MSIKHLKSVIFCFSFKLNEKKKVLFRKIWFVISAKKKKLFSVLVVTHGDPIFAQVGPKNGSF